MDSRLYFVSLSSYLPQILYNPRPYLLLPIHPPVLLALPLIYQT